MVFGVTWTRATILLASAVLVLLMPGMRATNVTIWDAWTALTSAASSVASHAGAWDAGNVITAAGVLIALGLGLWANGVSGWFIKPRLAASIEPRLPDCHVVEYGSDTAKVSDQYYSRLRVTNRGSLAANSAEVLVYRLWAVTSGMSRGVTTMTATEVEPFLQLNLNWSHVKAGVLTPDREIVMPVIPTEVFRHCDLCFVDSRDPTRFILSTQITPRRIQGKSATVQPPGDYELDVILFALNSTPQFVTVSIRFSGRWPADNDYTSLIVTKVIYQGAKEPTHPIN